MVGCHAVNFGAQLYWRSRARPDRAAGTTTLAVWRGAALAQGAVGGKWEAAIISTVPGSPVSLKRRAIIDPALHPDGWHSTCNL